MVVRVTLKCLDDGHKAVKIAQGKTTIGRGPLLGCGDKKVSRNHAILEVTEEGKVNLTPIHVNPCFYQGKSVGLSTVLKKDRPQQLHTGDTFSLLPNSFRYQVVIEREESESSSDSSDSTKPPSPVKKDEVVKEEEKHDNASSPELPSSPSAGQAVAPSEKEETVIKDIKEPPQVKLENEINVQTTDNKKEENPTQRNRSDDSTEMIDIETADNDNTAKLVATPKAKHPAVVTEQKPRKRTLPSWLLKCTKVQVVAEETKPNPPKNRNAVARTDSRRTSYKRYSDNDSKVSLPTPSKARTSRPNRQTRQRISLDDYIVSDDDEWDNRSDEEYKPKNPRRRRGDDYESGSDWETEHGKKRRGRARESGSDRDDDHRRLRKRPRVTVEDDSGSDWERDRTRKKVTPKGRGRRHKKASESGEESDDNDKASTSERKRLPCMYGKDCYRKNVGHMERYIHPGDSDYAEPAEEDAEGNDNNKPDCPYGVDCYRKNLQHRKDYKHVKRTLPKREAAKKAGKKVNMMDDEYSFNDDESDEYVPGASGPDANSDSEDVTKLVKEAKDFVRNKKHQNAV